MLKDHPRMGGEKMKIARWQNRWKGSPPHGRGKAIPQDPLPDQEGITPAQAGKSRKSSGATSSSRDHPRMGGEKLHLLLCVPAGYGSPPRRRGKGPALHCSSPVPGITPAWAGKRSPEPSAYQPEWDHPRVGGEKSVLIVWVGAQCGSPPRGRGKAPASQPWSPPLWMMVIRPRP